MNTEQRPGAFQMVLLDLPGGPRAEGGTAVSQAVCFHVICSVSWSAGAVVSSQPPSADEGNVSPTPGASLRPTRPFLSRLPAQLWILRIWLLEWFMVVEVAIAVKADQPVAGSQFRGGSSLHSGKWEGRTLQPCRAAARRSPHQALPLRWPVLPLGGPAALSRPDQCRGAACIPRCPCQWPIRIRRGS